MASHKTELRITVVDDFDWPAVQEWTPNSLCPQDVTLDGEDALSPSRLTPSLTPNSLFGQFAWAESKTPTSSHTFGFPLSPALSTVSKFSPDTQSPLEKHKRRLRRYTTAESVLARVPSPSSLSPSQLRANALHYAAGSVAAHIREARQSLRAVRSSGRRDDTRWMAEHRLAALESMQAQIASTSTAPVGGDEDAARRKCEANLVRFLGARRSQGLVPVFTRPHGRRPPMSATAEAEYRRMTVGSPMKLQSDAMPVPQTSRKEWPWETRVRAVLLYPPHKPSVTPSLRVLTPTSSVALSTPTSSSFGSIIEPETPLTEVEEDDEDEFEDYPTFRLDSVRSYSPDSAWQHPRPLPRPPLRSKAPPPHPLPPLPPLPPITTSLTPDGTYAWLADPSTWASPSGWRGDGWEVVPTSASSTASPTSTSGPLSASSTSSFPASPLPPRTPTRVQTLPPAPAHRFWTRERHRRLPSLRPISEAAAYTVRPLPAPPVTPPHKKRNFFSGLVRRGSVQPPAEVVREAEREEREREANKLRKRGSVRSFASTRSGQSSLEEYSV
ncbi:hypothetical protein DFH06DRAFT_1467758 [Mycena polygramma]|nr:hypothetical protein DFH06DRAFT_1467758 [Mycena polygramma]